jgi:uncharacterized protein YjbI with pentapeptide repeats
VFDQASLRWADFSAADLSGAQFAGADLQSANLHAVIDTGTNWSRATLKQVRRTDQARLKAESWIRPPRSPA